MIARRLAVAAALAATAVIAVGTGALAGSGQLEHLPVPVLRDARLAKPAAMVRPERLEGCSFLERARVPARITALLEGEDGLWVGTFDGGAVVLRRSGRAQADLDGRERFVNALAGDDGGVWVATQRGAVYYWRGERVRTALAGLSVSALARAGDRLYAGTGRGLFRIDPDGSARAVPLEGTDGPPRITALAATPAHLWLGTPSGAYLVPRSRDGSLLGRARWMPLVFGAPGAETNAVTALSGLGEAAAVAGTDDGGLVLLRTGGEVSAVRLWPAAANQVNPGAMAAVGDRVLAGTQGGGLLEVGEALDRSSAALRVSRAEGADGLSISAVVATEGGWLAGTADGRVLAIRCPAPPPLAPDPRAPSL